MTWVATAVIGGAVIGGVVSSKNAKKGVQASNQAAELQSEAANQTALIQSESANRALEENRRQFDVTQQNIEPFRLAGERAVGQQQALLGLQGQEQQQTAFDQFNQSPGQAFLQKRAERSLLRNQAAIGGLGGGNVRSALQEQAIGFAQQDYGNEYNRLAGLSGTGQVAATNLGQLGGQFANQNSNLLNRQSESLAGGVLGGAQARASGLLGAQQARATGTNQLLGIGGSLLGGFFNGGVGGVDGAGR